MKITAVTVEVGTTIPHPRFQYSSVKETIGASAALEDGESPSKAIAKLQEYLGALLAARLTKRMEEDL